MNLNENMFNNTSTFTYLSTHKRKKCIKNSYFSHKNPQSSAMKDKICNVLKNNKLLATNHIRKYIYMYMYIKIFTYIHIYVYKVFEICINMSIN